MSTIGQKIGSDAERKFLIQSLPDGRVGNGVTFTTPQGVGFELVSIRGTIATSAVAGLRTPLLDLVWSNQRLAGFVGPISVGPSDDLEVYWLRDLGEVQSGFGRLTVPIHWGVCPPGTVIQFDFLGLDAGDQVAAVVVSGFSIPL